MPSPGHWLSELQKAQQQLALERSLREKAEAECAQLKGELGTARASLRRTTAKYWQLELDFRKLERSCQHGKLTRGPAAAQSPLNSTKPAMPAAMPMAPVEASGNIRDPMLDLPNLLDWLRVPEILSLRTTCKQATNPEELLQHAVEAAALCRSASVLSFHEIGRWLVAVHQPLKEKVAAMFQEDPSREKSYYCQVWVLELAAGRTTLPVDSKEMLNKVTTHLARHCRDGDDGVRNAAHRMLQELGDGAPNVVIHQILEVAIGLMGSLLSPHPSLAGVELASRREKALEYLQQYWHFLTLAQCRKWSSLLTRMRDDGVYRGCFDEIPAQAGNQIRMLERKAKICMGGRSRNLP